MSGWFLTGQRGDKFGDLLCRHRNDKWQRDLLSDNGPRAFVCVWEKHLGRKM